MYALSGESVSVSVCFYAEGNADADDADDDDNEDNNCWLLFEMPKTGETQRYGLVAVEMPLGNVALFSR